MNRQKKEIREALKKKRHLISMQRREDATLFSFLELVPALSQFDKVLSFASFNSELDLSLLNHYLADIHRLYLPKIEGTSLEIYQVNNLEKDLIPNSYGILEPNPARCQKISKKAIPVVLIPALGFDKNHHRIGYGGGYYDRFLPDISAHTIGIGFREQLLDNLPLESTDYPLKEVLLF